MRWVYDFLDLIGRVDLNVLVRCTLKSLDNHHKRRLVEARLNLPEWEFKRFLADLRRFLADIPLMEKVVELKVPEDFGYTKRKRTMNNGGDLAGIAKSLGVDLTEAGKKEDKPKIQRFKLKKDFDGKCLRCGSMNIKQIKEWSTKKQEDRGGLKVQLYKCLNCKYVFRVGAPLKKGGEG